ncbi:72_t:CDS:2, partial [Dentiscutata erythropus]
SNSSSSSEDALTVLTEEQKIHLQDEVRVLIEGGALANLKLDPSKKWREQSHNIW